MDKREALATVSKMITTDRNDSHGEAIDQLSHAQLLKQQVGHHSSPYLTLAEVEALDMICVKLSRLAKGRPILDHFLDIIGYAAIAVEARSAADAVKPTVITEPPEKITYTKGPIPAKAIGDK